MSTKTYCDRCGEEITRAGGVVGRGTRGRNGQFQVTVQKDLCGTCEAALIEFLEGKAVGSVPGCASERQEQTVSFQLALGNWGGPDNDPIMTSTQACAFVRLTSPDEHHERCCTLQGRSRDSLCDCGVLEIEYNRRAGLSLS